MSTLSTYFPTGGGGGDPSYSNSNVTKLFTIPRKCSGNIVTNYCNGYVTSLYLQCDEASFWCAQSEATRCTCACQFNCCQFIKVYASRACKVEKGCWCVLKENELIGCHPLYWSPFYCSFPVSAEVFPTADGGYVISNCLHNLTAANRKCYAWKSCNAYLNQLCCCKQCVTIVDPSVTCACTGTQTSMPTSPCCDIFWGLTGNTRLSFNCGPIKGCQNLHSTACCMLFVESLSDSGVTNACELCFDLTTGFDHVADPRRLIAPVKYFVGMGGYGPMTACNGCSDFANANKCIAFFFPNTASFCFCACNVSSVTLPNCINNYSALGYGIFNYHEHIYNSPKCSALSIMEMWGCCDCCHNFYTFCYNECTGCANYFVGKLDGWFTGFCDSSNAQVNRMFYPLPCAGDITKIAVSVAAHKLCYDIDTCNSQFQSVATHCDAQALRIHLICNCTSTNCSCTRVCYQRGACQCLASYLGDCACRYKGPYMASVSDNGYQNMVLVWPKGNPEGARSRNTRLFNFNWGSNCISPMISPSGYITCLEGISKTSETCTTTRCFFQQRERCYYGTGLADLVGGVHSRTPRRDHILVCDTASCTVVYDSHGRFFCGEEFLTNFSDCGQATRPLQYNSSGGTNTPVCVSFLCSGASDCRVCSWGGFGEPGRGVELVMGYFDRPNSCCLIFAGTSGRYLEHCCIACTCSCFAACNMISKVEYWKPDSCESGEGVWTRLGETCFWLSYNGGGTAQNQYCYEVLNFWDYRSFDCWKANSTPLNIPGRQYGNCHSTVMSTAYWDNANCCVYIIQAECCANLNGNRLIVNKVCWDTTGLLGTTSFASGDIGSSMEFGAAEIAGLQGANLGGTVAHKPGSLVICCQAALFVSSADCQLNVIEWGDT